MHLLITDAVPASRQALDALTALDLPNLRAIVQRLRPQALQHDQPESLSPLPERLHAQALGIATSDGAIPWAALQAQARGLQLSQPDAAWAFITPCLWQVQADHVTMPDPSTLHISPQEGADLLQAMQPYFAEDGITLHPLAQDGGSWLAEGRVFKGLATASIARVRGGAVDAWLPRQTEARTLRRLQNEMQMLLYTHPVNDARAQRGLPAVNSFWVSGTGDLPPAGPRPLGGSVRRLDLGARVQQVLGSSASAHPYAQTTQEALTQAWVQAWREADATVLAALLQAARAEPAPSPTPSGLSPAPTLTLCGPHAALRFTWQPQGAWERLRSRWMRPDLASFLTKL